MFFKKKASQKYDEAMNELLEKAKTPRDRALIGIAIHTKNISGKFYELADPMKGYTMKEPQRVYDFVLKTERELDEFMSQLERELEDE